MRGARGVRRGSPSLPRLTSGYLRILWIPMDIYGCLWVSMDTCPKSTWTQGLTISAFMQSKSLLFILIFIHPPGVRQICPTWIFAEHQLHVHMLCFLVRSPAAKLLDADCKTQCGRTGTCVVNVCGPDMSICKCHHTLSHETNNVVPSNVLVAP